MVDYNRRDDETRGQEEVHCGTIASCEYDRGLIVVAYNIRDDKTRGREKRCTVVLSCGCDLGSIVEDRGRTILCSRYDSDEIMGGR